MNYQVIARKWRPQTFAEIVGQQHVTRTLQNAIESGRVAHAYIFSGARGVGKTTTARILAKALNCVQGPTSSPCNECASCREIAVGSSLEVGGTVSFAPIASAELRAFVDDVASPAELEDDLIEELAHGLTLSLNAYADMGFESFNLAMYGAPPGSSGYPLNLRIACRSNLKPYYRSDSTLLERLHWEGAIDLPPETIAERIRERFPA